MNLVVTTVLKSCARPTEHRYIIPYERTAYRYLWRLHAWAAFGVAVSLAIRASPFLFSAHYCFYWQIMNLLNNFQVSVMTLLLLLAYLAFVHGESDRRLRVKKTKISTCPSYCRQVPANKVCVALNCPPPCPKYCHQHPRVQKCRKYACDNRSTKKCPAKCNKDPSNPNCQAIGCPVCSKVCQQSPMLPKCIQRGCSHWAGSCSAMTAKACPIVGYRKAWPRNKHAMQ